MVWEVLDSGKKFLLVGKLVNYEIKKWENEVYEKETYGVGVIGCVVFTVGRNDIWSRFFGWNGSRSVW